MHEVFKTLVKDSMCKGRKENYCTHRRSINGADVAKECFAALGKQDAANAVLPLLANDTPQTYINRLSEDFHILPYGPNFVFQDHDWLLFAWSLDGTEGMRTEEVMAPRGNVTTGFLIEAAGDYPIVWLTHEPGTESGVFPLADCLAKRWLGEMVRGKVDVVFRFKE